MKLKIELVTSEEEQEVTIKCVQITDEIKNLQQYIKQQNISRSVWSFYKGSEQFFLPISDILFFETGGATIYAHSANEAYEVNYKLYELESLLPESFMRVSKSTILNVKYIYSIQKDLTSSSRVQFKNCSKEVYVSRRYYKLLKYKLQERMY